MLYKGKEIVDHFYACKEETLSTFDHNEQVFDLDDIEVWKKSINKKTEELKDMGVDFKPVMISIRGEGYHYNPGGADDDPYMEVALTWFELETDEEKGQRIARKKKWIDQMIEEEKERAEHEKQRKEIEIQEYIKVLRSNGYKVI